MTHSFAEQRTSSQHETSTHTPIGWCMPIIYANSERSWVKFKNVKDPAYNSSLLHEAPNIIYAKEILIEERVNKVSKMIEKSLTDFQKHLKQYTMDLTTRIKRATAKRDYGFVRKPELRHQYGMLFNHHGQVISGLKNMDLFLSIDLPKIEDIAHVPPPFRTVTTGLLHTSQTKIVMCISPRTDLEETTMDP